MTQEDCQKQADALFGQAMVLEKRNGVCCISLPAIEAEPEGGPGRPETRVGQGPSWKAALRYAAMPIAKARRQQEIAERQEAERELQLFEAFLRDRFDEEFEAWKAEKFPTAPTPAPEPIAAPEAAQAAPEAVPEPEASQAAPAAVPEP